MVGAESLPDTRAKLRGASVFDWNDLRHFLAVARRGSIGATAKALGVNQSTVQRRLLALERGLGCVLVERHATGYRLTEHGQILLASVTDVEAAVDAVQRRVASFDDKDVGPVRVTCLVTVGQRIVRSGLLDAFHARHRGMVVELLMEQRMLDLSKGEADIAIRGGTPGPGALVGRKIAELPWGIYASRAFIERHGRPAEPRDIERFAVVELIDELENLPAVRWMRLHASQARIAARCANIPSVHLAVKSGAGLAPLPAVHAAADADLVSVLGTIPELNYPMFLVTHKDVRRRPRVNAFFEFCVRELKPVLLQGMMGPGNSRDDGMARHPSYQDIRQDKPAAVAHREVAPPSLEAIAPEKPPTGTVRNTLRGAAVTGRTIQRTR
jgi:DNA-binding transcriptional LysR family regulator